MLRPGHGLALLALASMPAGAFAADSPKAAVAICGIPTEGKAADTLAERVRDALKGRRELELISAGDEAYLFRSVRPKHNRSRANLELAKKHLKQASSSFAAFDLADAMRGISKAKQALAEWAGLREAVDLDRERLQLAVAIAHAQRNEPHLKEALKEYATRFPNEPPPPGLWPPELVNRSRAAAPHASTVLTVQSEPRGTVFIDGREVGPSPVRLGALVGGEHTVEVACSGFFPFDARVETIAQRDSVLQVKLLPDLSKRLKSAKIDQPLPEELLTSIRQHGASQGLKTLILASVTKDGKLAVRQVDLSSKDDTAHARAIVQADNAPEGAGIAVGQLFQPAAAHAEPDHGVKVPTWAWIGAGTGGVAVGAGIFMRMLAVSTHKEFDLRQGALTQTEAYELRDRASTQATGGAVLLGLGVAAIAGIAGWVVYDQPADHGS